jgi:hypothetical protein
MLEYIFPANIRDNVGLECCKSNLEIITAIVNTPYPSVADWWRTVRLHTDQTGSNVTGNFVLSGEFCDSRVSLAMQFIIKTAVKAHLRALYLHPHNGLHLVLTSQETDVLKKHKTKLVVQL